jgi:hypothetical protein
MVGVVEDTVYTSVLWKKHAMYFTPLMQAPPAPIALDDPIAVTTDDVRT